MKKKIVALLIAASMACAPVAVYAAEDTDARISELESEVASLKERIESIEQLITGSEQTEKQTEVTTPKESETEVSETEASIDANSETDGVDLNSLQKIENKGCTLYYVGSQLDTDYSGKPCFYVYGYFVNNSDSKKAASLAFLPEAYQDGIALDTMIYSQNVAFQNHSTFVLPGADPLQVAFGFELRNTVSDVVLTINPMFSLSNTDAFSMTLTMPKN